MRLDRNYMEKAEESLDPRTPPGPRLVECGKNPWWRHRQVVKANAGGAGDRVGDRRQRRHDRRLAYASHPIRVARVRHLDDHGVDHGQIGGDRHAIVEEAWVLQLAVAAVDVLLVERPADALRHAALELAFDVARVDGTTSVLDRRVAHHRHLASLG